MHKSNRAFADPTEVQIKSPYGRLVAVQLLTGRTVFVALDSYKHAKIADVYAQVVAYVTMNDPQLFGLSYVYDGQFLFVEMDSKVSKIAPKSWKLSSQGLDEKKQPLLTLHFRVKFYVDCHLLLRDRIARQHYYLQLRQNMLERNHACSEEMCFQMAAHALQADFGNFSAEKHCGKYFEPKLYFPAWVLSYVSEPYTVQHLPAMHRDCFGSSRCQAQSAYIAEVAAPDSLTTLNLHLYRVYKKKNVAGKDAAGGQGMSRSLFLWIGVCETGLQVYEDQGGSARQPMATFQWANISKLHHDKRKFEVIVHSRRYSYYATNDQLPRNLLSLARHTHQFHLMIQPLLLSLKTELVKQHNRFGSRRGYRESYADGLDWTGLSVGQKHPVDQRTSVISNASSNTTSGIDSDRIDNSEDELDMSVMSSMTGDCYPLTSSTYSLYGAVSYPFLQLHETDAYQHSQQRSFESQSSASTVQSQPNNHPNRFPDAVVNLERKTFAGSAPSLFVSNRLQLAPSCSNLAGSVLTLAKNRPRMKIGVSSLTCTLPQHKSGYASPTIPPPLAYRTSLASYNSIDSLEDKRILSSVSSLLDNHTRKATNLQYRDSGLGSSDYSSEERRGTRQKPNKPVARAMTNCEHRSNTPLDITHLKHRSDLPLISALCNDNSLAQSASCSHLYKAEGEKDAEVVLGESKMRRRSCVTRMISDRERPGSWNVKGDFNVGNLLTIS